MKYLNRIENALVSWLMCENYNGNYVKLFVIFFRVLLFVAAQFLLLVFSLYILPGIITN